ncbi:MAG: hypothetical protein EOP56_08305 [Sphingobacteriales bacterium]|nr:MAG: hypothetical protein EOP56_08305 [Sphingobacteriales bacterium]
MKTIIAAALLLATFSSCYTAQKAGRQVLRAQTTYPLTLASLCGQLYPPKDSVHTELLYLQGETQYMPGEVRYVNCDSGSNKGNNKVHVPCPPARLRVDTVRNTRISYLVNRARETELAVRLTTAQADNKRMHAQKKRLMYWAFIATAASLLLLTLSLKLR